MIGQQQNPLPHSQVSRIKAAKPLERNCSVGRTVNIIGDGWSFMILREGYFGVRRFKHFQSMLGLPRGTLSARLSALTEQGLLRKVQYSERPPRSEYRLTMMGFDLYSVMLSLLAFGDKWLAGGEPPPLKMFHIACYSECHPFVACSACGEEIRATRLKYRDGPGAGWAPMAIPKKSRRSVDPTVLERRRPSSVARALQVIGDRWSFMVVREAFFGVRRFDDWQARLGIAPNILSDRLKRFVNFGIFDRIRYQTQPERFEYRLTDMGRDLIGPFAAMLRWGDQWLSGNNPPLIHTHLDCGHDFTPKVVCDHCREPITAAAMRYEMAYPEPALE
jgi:DNA-binding HxlR family transcriptional regulator